jgi:hypothetical protein
MSTAPEVWLRGPLAGFSAQALPAAHSLRQTAEEVERAARRPAPLTPAQLWARPAGVASAGYHLAHLAGSTERLLTYAAGRALDAAQTDALAAEEALLVEGVAPEDRPGSTRWWAARWRRWRGPRRAVRDTPPALYEEARHVGRARLATTVWGLLFHVAEHAQRHAGQLATTARLRGAADRGQPPRARLHPERPALRRDGDQRQRQVGHRVREHQVAERAGAAHPPVVDDAHSSPTSQNGPCSAANSSAVPL